MGALQVGRDANAMTVSLPAFPMVFVGLVGCGMGSYGVCRTEEISVVCVAGARCAYHTLGF